MKELRRFLGMASWYRRFIPNYSTIVAPLNLLLRKKQPWIWSDKQSSAFYQIRNCLINTPILSCPNFNIPFELQTDASTLGAVLTQQVDGIEYVISYASRSLADAEKNYITTELECLGIIWAIKKYREYLEGYHFTVVTDHASLKWLHNLKNPTGRSARWSLSLLEYDFKIIHRKGSSHHVPGALSRMYETPGEHLNLIQKPNSFWYFRRFLEVKDYPSRFPNWKILNDKLYHFRPDPILSILVQDLNEW